MLTVMLLVALCSPLAQAAAAPALTDPFKLDITSAVSTYDAIQDYASAYDPGTAQVVHQWQPGSGLRSGAVADLARPVELAGSGYDLHRHVVHTYYVVPQSQDGTTTGSAVLVHNANAETCGYTYNPRIRERGIEDPKYHNFPYSMDSEILATTPVKQSDGSLLYRLHGTVTGRDGYYEIAVNPKTKVIFHRQFKPVKK